MKPGSGKGKHIPHSAVRLLLFPFLLPAHSRFRRTQKADYAFRLPSPSRSARAKTNDFQLIYSLFCSDLVLQNRILLP